MRYNKYPQDRNPKPTTALRPNVAVASGRSEVDFIPSPDEVSRRAYFSYVNQGSLPGHDVQHWLAAEAELIAERNLTRLHGFHNPT